MKETEPAVLIQGLTKTFVIGLRRKRTEALRGLDLEVQPGEVFGFLGPNGAGKTTAIKILVGLLKADAGQARLFGRSVRDEQARKKIAYLPELPDFYDYLNPVEFLRHCGKLSGLKQELLSRRIPELLEKVSLNPNEKRPLRKFSKGMLQRVGIAQTMLADPDLYIMDEPMGGLDPLGRRWVKDLILELGKKGKTVFFSSHVLAEAEAVCDRVAFLYRGRLIAQGSLREVMQAQTETWEILVAGQEAAGDVSLKSLCQHVLQAGEDTLMVPSEGKTVEEVLKVALQAGYKLLSVNRHHTSLEEIFIRTVDARNLKEEA